MKSCSSMFSERFIFKRNVISYYMKKVYKEMNVYIPLLAQEINGVFFI